MKHRLGTQLGSVTCRMGSPDTNLLVLEWRYFIAKVDEKIILERVKIHENSTTTF